MRQVYPNAQSIMKQFVILNSETGATISTAGYESERYVP